MQNIPTIESVSIAIAEWRRHGGKRLSASLWEEISALKGFHSLKEISQATGISSQYLGKKLSKGRGRFVEVKMGSPGAIAVLPPTPATVIEVRRPDGTKIRVRFASNEAATLLRGLLQ